MNATVTTQAPTMRLVKAVMRGAGCSRHPFAEVCLIHRAWRWDERDRVCTRAVRIAGEVVDEIPEANQP